MLSLDINTGRLFSDKMKINFADRPYCYALSGSIENSGVFENVNLVGKNCERKENEITVMGNFESISVGLSQVFSYNKNCLAETITFKNNNSYQSKHYR